MPHWIIGNSCRDDIQSVFHHIFHKVILNFKLQKLHNSNISPLWASSLVVMKRFSKIFIFYAYTYIIYHHYSNTSGFCFKNMVIKCYWNLDLTIQIYITIKKLTTKHSRFVGSHRKAHLLSYQFSYQTFGKRSIILNYISLYV